MGSARETSSRTNAKVLFEVGQVVGPGAAGRKG